MRPRWTHVLLLAICAALAFGGSFTCKAHSGDDEVEFHSGPSTRPAG